MLRRNSTAMPIEWHKQCLKNCEESISSLREQLYRVEERLAIELSQADFYEFQILEAIEEGKKAFDADRYRIKEKDQF